MTKKQQTTGTQSSPAWPEAFADWESGGAAVRWKPQKKGDIVWGTLVEDKIVTMAATGSKKRVITLRREGRAWFVICSALLEQRLSVLRPRLGDEVAIMYQGTQPPTRPGRSPMQLYEVRMRPHQEEPADDNMGDAAVDDEVPF